MGNKRDPASVIAERDKHIARLEAQIQVYAARTSQTHARLLSTLDAMDELRTKHTREIKAEKRAKERLDAKVYRYLDELKRAEVERDEMKEVASVLLEKVELSTDYARWPRSEIQLTSPLEPLHEQPSLVPSGDAKVLQTYASAVVTSLRLELDAERRAHAETQEQAESSILSLNAQLATREAELEAYSVHSDNSPVPQKSSDPRSALMAQKKRRATQPPPPPPVVRTFSRQEAIKVLEITASKNRALELEVKELVETLEKARRTTNTPEPPSRVISDRSRTGGGPSTVIGSFPQKSSGSAKPNSSSSTTAPPLPPDSAPPSPSSPGLPPFASSAQVSPSPHTSIVMPPAPSDRQHLPEQHPLSTLEEEINTLSAGIDAFKAERDALKAVIRQGRQTQGSGAHEQPAIDVRRPAHAHIEEEYMRLVHSEDALRRELEAVRESGRRREEELLGRIKSLQQASSAATSEHSTGTTLSVASAAPHAEKHETAEYAPLVTKPTTAARADILNDDEAVISMDLASPLHPTILSLQANHYN